MLLGTSVQGYGVTLTVGIGIPIPILNEEICRYTAIKDEELWAQIVDYGEAYPQGKKESLGEANYKQLIELAELLPEYDFVGEGNLGRQKADCESSWYCATFFRRDTIRLLDDSNNADTYWLSPTPEVPASQFRLGTRPRLVTWNTFELIETNSTFVFGTTHLEAINSSHRKRSAQLLREYVDRKVEEMGDSGRVAV